MRGGGRMGLDVMRRGECCIWLETGMVGGQEFLGRENWRYKDTE